ncbi:MAG: hypothetical protein ACRDSH_12365 [Pseudonocardiaceae bacterium]
MSSLPPELADPVEQLRMTLVEINGSEQACMTNALLTKSFTKAQAVMARCRQASAAAAATAVDAFLHACSEISARANSGDTAAIVTAAAKSVSTFWTHSESSASALVSEAAAMLPAQGLDNTTQAVKSTCSERASSINRYFEQLVS